MSGGIQHHVTAVLEQLNALGGYLKALVCTDDGLLVAVAGSSNADDEDLAAFASLFDTVACRERREYQGRNRCVNNNSLYVGNSYSTQAHRRSVWCVRLSV